MSVFVFFWCTYLFLVACWICCYNLFGKLKWLIFYLLFYNLPKIEALSPTPYHESKPTTGKKMPRFLPPHLSDVHFPPNLRSFGTIFSWRIFIYSNHDLREIPLGRKYRRPQPLRSERYKTREYAASMPSPAATTMAAEKARLCHDLEWGLNHLWRRAG